MIAINNFIAVYEALSSVWYDPLDEEVFISSSIDIIKNNTKVVPKPNIAPKTAIVYEKNFLPTKAIMIPSNIIVGLKIYGLSIRNLVQVIAEKTGHPLT